MGKNAKLKEKQKRSHEKPQLDNARKLRGIYFIDTEDTKRPSRMLARNWRHQWLPLCLARWAKIVKIGWLVVNPRRSKQDLRVLWKLVNLQDCVWKNLYRIIIKIILQEKERIHLVHKFIPMPQAMKIPAAKAAVDKEWEKLEKIFRRGTWQKSEVRNRWSMKQERPALQFILHH